MLLPLFVFPAVVVVVVAAKVVVVLLLLLVLSVLSSLTETISFVISATAILERSIAGAAAVTAAGARKDVPKKVNGGEA